MAYYLPISFSCPFMLKHIAENIAKNRIVTFEIFIEFKITGNKFKSEYINPLYDDGLKHNIAKTCVS